MCLCVKVINIHGKTNIQTRLETQHKRYQFCSTLMIKFSYHEQRILKSTLNDLKNEKKKDINIYLTDNGSIVDLIFQPGW